MDGFGAIDGELYCEGVPLSQIASEVQTPVYVYSAAKLESRYLEIANAFKARRPLLAYAVKANSNLAVLRTLARMGAGADTVSEGEIRRAIRAGIPASRIVFSGVGKSRAELEYVVAKSIHQINVESEPELDLLADVAEKLKAEVAIGLRVNPDVSAGDHEKISTGRTDNKFGVSIAEAKRLYKKASANDHLDVVGLACHIGSQIADLAPFRAAFTRLTNLADELRNEGLGVRRLDLGGGLGIEYNTPVPSIEQFAAMCSEVLGDVECDLILEPGRYIAGPAGVLLASVTHVHSRPEGQKFLVLDAAMNDLMRPVLYEAFHEIVPINNEVSRAEHVYQVVGPVCETGDTFAKDRRLPDLDDGDVVAFMSAGAYGASMASEYNTRPLVPEVLVSGTEYAVVRQRPSYDDMFEREPFPSWLKMRPDAASHSQRQAQFALYHRSRKRA